MNFRYQCLSCDYFTSTKCNIVRHNKSTLHLRLCQEIEEGKDQLTCKCGKKCKTRQSFSYHKKNCESIILPLFSERILKNEIDIIKTTLEPISLKSFIENIEFHQDDFELSSLLRENIDINTLNIIKREMNKIEQINRPIQNFNEDSDQLKIHYFDDGEWKMETELSLLCKTIKNGIDGYTYEKNSFMYYINLFHERRLSFYREKCNDKPLGLLNLSISSGNGKQHDLIKNIMSLVTYKI